jgi:protease PrsW
MNTAVSPLVYLYAFLGGVLPTLVWLWFWIRQDIGTSDNSPRGMVLVTFIAGAFAVPFAVIFQKILIGVAFSTSDQIIALAMVEEILKYAVVFLLVSRNRFIQKPIDYAVYFLAVGLGFAALENTLYLIEPLTQGDTIAGLLTGHIRFLGSSLLHAMTGAVIGIMAGLSFYENTFYKKIHILLGLLGAIALHAVFNFFILKEAGGEAVFRILASVWVVAIINMMLFERLRYMECPDEIQNDIPTSV